MRVQLVSGGHTGYYSRPVAQYLCDCSSIPNYKPKLLRVIAASLVNFTTIRNVLQYQEVSNEIKNFETDGLLFYSSFCDHHPPPHIPTIANPSLLPFSISPKAEAKKYSPNSCSDMTWTASHEWMLAPS